MLNKNATYLAYSQYNQYFCVTQLKKYADNAYEGSKTWVKKDAQSNLMTDKEMIEHLKNKGYKIMKPVSDWVWFG